MSDVRRTSEDHPDGGAPLRLAVLLGSVRGGRFGPTVADWFVRRAEARADFRVDVIDPAEVGLPLAFPRPGDADAGTSRARQRLAERLAAADAFAVVTPEYNHSFPAALKNVIDWYNAEWHAKPVGFVSYGGLSGGLRAVEQLRLVFAELHAVTVRGTVSFHNAWSVFDDAGEPVDTAGSDKAAQYLFDQLHWWGEALREARAARPYPA